MSLPCRPNILVVSDLHLGEDLKPGTTPVSYLRRIAKLERELEAFLGHYGDPRSRIGGRPWRLVVNGDMVDFMSVMILPSEPDGGTADERQFGLAFGEAQTVEKLDHVARRHPGVFRALASFVAAGNELVVVVGNHDVEFHFPAVQRRFVEQLVAHLPEAPAGAPMAQVSAQAARAAQAAAAVRFCPWFYYEEARVYVEHGHQYDEYCSFDYQLHPVDDSGGVALSIAHAGIRYFTNLVPSIDPAVAEHWGFFDYARWAAGHGARSAARLCFLYGLFAWKAVALWRWISRGASDAERRARHKDQLRLMAAEYRIAEDKVRALDELRCVPVIKRLRKTLQTLFLDRLAVAAAALCLVTLLLIVAPGWMRLLGPLGTAIACVGAWWLLGRDHVVAPDAALRRVPEAIRAIVRAPFIVFGHSHRAEAVPLRGGGTYFNTGAWAHDDLSAAFTHLLITGDEQPHAELRQWRGGEEPPLRAPAAARRTRGAPAGGRRRLTRTECVTIPPLLTSLGWLRSAP